MPELDLEFNGDLILDQEGGLQHAAPGDALRQRIFRRVLTNPGEYIYHVDYGIGLGDLVGRTMNRDQIEKLKQRVIQGILEDAETDKSFFPEIKITEPGYKRMDIFARFKTISGVQDGLLIQLEDIE